MQLYVTNLNLYFQSQNNMCYFQEQHFSQVNKNEDVWQILGKKKNYELIPLTKWIVPDLPSLQWLYRNAANDVGCCREASGVLPIQQQTGKPFWDKASLWGAHLSYCSSLKGFWHCWHCLGHLSELSQLPLLYQREKGTSQKAQELERSHLEPTIMMW